MFSTRYDKNQKLWYGTDFPPLYNPQVSLAQVVLNSLSLFGSKVAQISDNNGIQLSFNDIKIKTIRAAQNLQTFDYKSGDVFMIIAKNSQDVAPITFASIAIGCPINTLDASFGLIEITHMMKITKPKVIFCDLECYEVVETCLKELQNEARIFCFGGKSGKSESVESLFKETHIESQFVPVKVDGANETAMILCSSGTTGLPKGVCLSHAAILDSMERYNVNCSDVMFCFSSLFWISGVITLFKGTLCGATRIITTDVFSAQLQIRLIEQYKITFCANAPHQIILIMKSKCFDKANFSSLKTLIVGGSKVPYFFKSELSPRLPNICLYAAYGMSETVGAISFDMPPKKEKDNVGRLCNGCCVKIVDDDGNNCDKNVVGEVCIKMAHKYLGYHGNPQATKELFDADNFIKTGDIGYFDDDGDLFINGRKKELLKYSNFPIVPSEIDAFLSEMPDIKMASVAGIPDSLGDLPAAVIVRTEGSNISEKEVCDLVADHFADHYKLRGGVYFVNTLPTTASGKVLRRKVTEIAIDRFNSKNV